MIISILLLGSVGLLWYIASARFYLRQAQMVEASLYLLILLALVGTSVLLPLTSRQRREKQWLHECTSPVVAASWPEHA